MIDLKALEQDPEGYIGSIRRRGEVPNLDVILEKSKQRKAQIQSTQELQTKRNAINEGMKKATPEERDAKRAELRAMGDTIAEHEAKVKLLDDELAALALVVPNP